MKILLNRLNDGGGEASSSVVNCLITSNKFKTISRLHFCVMDV